MLVLGYEAAVGKDTDYLGLTFALIAGVFWALYIRSSAKVGALVPGVSGLAVAMLVGAAFYCPGGGGCSGASADLECGAGSDAAPHDFWYRHVRFGDSL